MIIRVLFVFVLLLTALPVPGQRQPRVSLESVEPDKTTIFLACAPGVNAIGGKCGDSPEVRVKVRISGEDAANAKLTRNVSGGRVVATRNDEFRWDLSGVSPGKYMAVLTAEDRDGRSGETKTFTVTIERCPHCRQGDTCPAVELQTPEGLVLPGGKFEVRVKGPVPPQIASYNWTVSSGSIESGQGTPAVVAGADGVSGGTHVAVNLEITVREGFPLCQTTFSETVVIADVPEPVMFDEFSDTATCEDGNARLDSYFADLNNNPQDQGVIVVYDSPMPGRSTAWRREQLFRNYIRLRSFDPSRIKLIRGTYRTAATTQFWRVPPGAKEPDVLPANVEGPPIAPRPQTRKQYLYATEHMDGLPECDAPMYDLEAYASELNAEPRSRGRIVIGESSSAKFNRKRREIRTELIKQGVSKGRITFIYRYVRPNRLLETTELWVRP